MHVEHDSHSAPRAGSRSPKYLLKVVSHFWSSDVNRAAVDRLAPQPGETVLDIGAGLGPATIATSRRVGQHGKVIAIEPSPLMRFALRSRRLFHRNRRIITILDAFAEQLPLAGQSIDAVIALNVVHLLQDQRRVADELARVLTPRGRILFVEEDLDHPGHDFYEPDGHSPNHDHLGAGVDEMVEALRGAGIASNTQHVERLGDQPAHVITSTQR